MAVGVPPRVPRPGDHQVLYRIPDHLESIPRAAERFGVHRRTVRRWGERGLITIWKFGPRMLRVDPDEVRLLIAPVEREGEADVDG